MSIKRLNRNVRKHQSTYPAVGQTVENGGQLKTSPERVEKFYEKYAWVIISAIGVLTLVGGAPHALGVNTDPATVERIVGLALGEFKVSNPMFFNLYDFYFRAGGWSDMGFAFFITVISTTAYRRGEKWAWSILWSAPAFFLGHAAITLSIGPSTSHLIPYLTLFVALSLLGLLLPVRRFFPKENSA